MSDDEPAGRIPFHRQFPALRIFDAASLALSPVAIVIAVVALALLSLGGWLVDLVLPSVESHPEVSATSPMKARSKTADRSTDSSDATAAAGDARPGFVPSNDQLNLATRLISSTVFVQNRTIPGIAVSMESTLTRPWSSVIDPVTGILSSEHTWGQRLNQLLQFAIAISIWSFAGIVLCRRSAFVFCGNDDSSLPRSIDYAARRWPACVGAPLIPLISTALIGFVVSVFGLVGRLPFFGSSWMIAGSPVVMILGFVMAFLLLATALSWPLMVAAVSIDDSESFGSLSRAYSSLTGRPWQVVGYAVVALLAGELLVWGLNLFAELTEWCAMASTAFGSGNDAASHSLRGPLHGLIHAIISGIGVSYFWSVATVVYLLLRQDVDGVPLDRIADDDQVRPVRDPLPVVGIPATDAKIESNGSASSGEN